MLELLLKTSKLPKLNLSVIGATKECTPPYFFFIAITTVVKPSLIYIYIYIYIEINKNK
jgi:hypothetical protein